jgi:pimeloyl-ACP methyl ester carboxylesterase
MLSTFHSFDDSVISYTKVGNDKKQKVVMIHGFLANRLMWLPYIAPLLDEYYFLLIELRGHGTSKVDVLHIDNIIDDTASDIWTLIQRETKPTEKVKLVGMSMGCLCSLRMMDLYGHEKIEKYINIDHALEFMNHPDMNKRVFLEKHDTFLETCGIIYNKIKEEPELHGKFLYNLPKDLYNNLMKLCDIFLVSSAITGIKSRFSFIDNIPYFRHIASAIINYPFRWDNYLYIGLSYKRHNYNYCEIVKKLPIDIVFFVGVNSKLFNPEYHIETIKECKPNAKIITFEKSGHDLMINEPIYFYESLRDSLKSDIYMKIENATVTIHENENEIIYEVEDSSKATDGEGGSKSMDEEAIDIETDVSEEDIQEDLEESEVKSEGAEKEEEVDTERTDEVLEMETDTESVRTNE